jgi:NADP-dependent 3-hydroxy acid dehydrogenase YdfG
MAEATLWQTLTALTMFRAVFVVFGASGGIGSCLSKRLLGLPGSTVLLAGRDENRLQQLQQSIGGGVPIVGDPLDAKQVGVSTILIYI